MEKDKQLTTSEKEPISLGDSQPLTTNLGQVGDHNTQIAHVENYDASQQIININYFRQSPGLDEEKFLVMQQFSREYYQLLVTYDEKIFENNIITFPREKVLTHNLVPDEIFERCSSLEQSGIDELKTFPAIICVENNDFSGRINPPQTACFGYIKKVQKLRNQVKVVFEPINTFDQSKLCNQKSAAYFDLIMGPGITTLNVTAWSVHKTDVFEAFKEAGIDYIKPIQKP